MKGSLKKPKPEALRCVRCSTPLDLTTLKDDTFGFAFAGYRCPSCGNQALSMDQLDLYNSLRDQARGLLLQRRKIQKIGNSLGLTLPAALHDLIRPGMQVEIVIVDPQTFQIKVVADAPTKSTKKRRAA